MKCTPAWTMTSASVLGRLAGQAQAVADEVADAVEDVRRHVVVGRMTAFRSTLRRRMASMSSAAASQSISVSAEGARWSASPPPSALTRSGASCGAWRAPPRLHLVDGQGLGANTPCEHYLCSGRVYAPTGGSPQPPVRRSDSRDVSWLEGCRDPTDRVGGGRGSGAATYQAAAGTPARRAATRRWTPTVAIEVELPQ